MKKLGNQVMIGRLSNTCQIVNASFFVQVPTLFSWWKLWSLFMIKKSQLFTYLHFLV